MDHTAVMPSISQIDEPTTPSAPSKPTPAAKKKEHWLVEVAGGFTVAGTMLSALSMWYLMLTYVILPS